MITEFFYVVLIMLFMFFLAFGISYVYLDNDFIATLIIFDFFLGVCCLFQFITPSFWSVVFILLVLIFYLLFKE